MSRRTNNNKIENLIVELRNQLKADMNEVKNDINEIKENLKDLERKYEDFDKRRLEYEAHDIHRKAVRHRGHGGTLQDQSLIRCHAGVFATPVAERWHARPATFDQD